VPLPDPHPGLVIRYSYLWASEHRRGRESGAKERPCAVILAKQVFEGRVVVTVVPVTHSPPEDGGEAVEIPATIKRLLDLDDLPSWIVLSEVNDFLWPGPDLAPIPGSDPARYDYGVLPPGFFDTIRNRLIGLAKARRIELVPRSE
jgi:PemK-like, MazF-like toxin of type II toxin-antitoxin system